MPCGPLGRVSHGHAALDLLGDGSGVPAQRVLLDTGIGAELETDLGDRLLPDCLGSPSSLAVRAGSSQSGAPLREGGGGRNLHWRQRSWTFRRPCQREEDPDVHRDRDPGAEGVRALSNGARGRCFRKSLHSFVSDNVEPGTTVITDAWQGYRGLEKSGYIHDRRSQRAASTRGEDSGELMPGVHRIASLAKRWLLGTHQGAAEFRTLAQLPG